MSWKHEYNDKALLACDFNTCVSFYNTLKITVPVTRAYKIILK